MGPLGLLKNETQQILAGTAAVSIVGALMGVGCAKGGAAASEGAAGDKGGADGGGGGSHELTWTQSSHAETEA